MKDLLYKLRFEYIFQFIVLIALVAYVFSSKDTDNIKLIIGAFIGVLSNVPKYNKASMEK